MYMEKKFPITVLINTINAGWHLDELFDSVLPYVEDVFIIDSRSTDDTVDICLRRGVKIVQRPFKKPSDQQSWARKTLPIKTDWVFGLAQDERFTPSLVADLQKLFEKGIPDDVDIVTFQWRIWFFGKPLHVVSPVRRLQRLSKIQISDVACDEHAFAPGKIMACKGVIEHKDFLNLHDWYEKQNLWTTLGAVGRITDRCEEERLTPFGTALQRKMFFKNLCVRTPVVGKMIQWIRFYFGFGAWKDGIRGLQWAALRMWVIKATDMKEREFRMHGIPKILPTARHGDFDPRVMKSNLERQLLPDLVAEWESRTMNGKK